ncbi:hypothetical protein [Azospirillum sp. B4]|uniref:hypothetical protein n=1 Tax=Azospirillum sp. B4 TaxID=95605 RepID=UPI0011DC8CBC|nr:hypothetical protein [Azospirillum sp. B4]
MVAEEDMTPHDYRIRRMGYGWLCLGTVVFLAGFSFFLAAAIFGYRGIDRVTGQPEPAWVAIGIPCVMMAGSSVFILLGRWVVRQYKMGRISGL